MHNSYYDGLNSTMGGDDNPSQNPECLRKMSKTWFGKNHPIYGKGPWNKGRTNIYSEEFLKNNRLNQPYRKSVICNNTKENFDSISDCARKLHIDKSSLSSHLKGKYPKTIKGNTFSYAIS